MDRSLPTLLRSLQTSSQYGDASRLLPSAARLLCTLSNPRNITLLASQLLSAPAIWSHSLDLRSCRGIFSVFYTAARKVGDEDTLQPSNLGRYTPRSLSQDDWIKAVVAGADESSPRWRHLLLIGGLLLGCAGQSLPTISQHLWAKLEAALVTAANLILLESEEIERGGRFCVVFVLNHTFELLGDDLRAQLSYDLLLPLLIDATFFSEEGLEHGYWLSMIDNDVVEVAGRKFEWSAKSTTFARVTEIHAKPLISSFGPLSRLIAHSAECVQDASHVSAMVDRVCEFGRTLTISWRQNKLSELDPSEEFDFLDKETTKTTLPVLWRLLRSSFFAVVIILRAALGRLICDPILSTNTSAPWIAMQCLHTLRNLHFISGRLGQTSSSQYLFVNLTAIDILTKYPESAENFLRSICPTELGHTPRHPVDRSLDLFYLNTAEHFTLTLSPPVNEEFLLTAARPYLTFAGNKNLLNIFEAAHSLTLAVLASPQNGDLCAKHLPSYIEVLFAVFPTKLSPRQFRLAFRTVIRITTPPSPLTNSQPMLVPILLDLVYERALQASASPLTPTSSEDSDDVSNQPPLSEQAVLTMALIDTLCFVPAEVLEESLRSLADLIFKIEDKALQAACQARLWEMLSGGEMDIKRAATCVAWWNSQGGREMVLSDARIREEPYMVTGALQNKL